MSIPLQQGIVYGPVASRRLGRSLGVNVLPDTAKVCNFDCAYCQYGWTGASHRGTGDEPWPDPLAIEAAVEHALSRGPAVDRLTLAGNGEPTLHPEFPEIVERLRDVRGRIAPRTRLAILSNSSTVAHPAIADALVRIDECYMKLDGGDTATLRSMNASGLRIEDLVEPLSRLGGVVLQSMFARDRAGRIDNTTDEAVSAWVAAVRRIRPMAVHVYSIDRDPAWADLRSVPRRTLEAIARRVEMLGIPATVYAR